MKLSIIIPAYNHLPDVLACLNSLQAFASRPHEYLVQDDSSPDYFGPAVIPAAIASCQRNETNLGFAGNCNAGAARAHGDVLFFVNQDVYGVPEWSPGWDAALLSAFDDPQVGIVGARLLFPNGCIQSAGGLYDAKKQPYHRCLGYSNPLCDETNTPEPVAWVTGAALAIRRTLFEQVGGFDTAYAGGYFEDTDLCCKVAQMGYIIWYEPRCTLVHKVGQSGGNPNFLRNAMMWRERWSAIIEADVYAVKQGFW